MRVPYLSCLLKKDTYTTIPLQITPHELALLSVMNGDDSITDVEPMGFDRDLEPSDEYERLGNAYGSGENGVPWVEAAFGKAHEGRLEATMESGAKHYAESKKTKGKAAA